MSAKTKLVLGYCPIGNGFAINPFDDVFDVGVNISHGMENVDAVVFWGGSDIHPSFYKQERHSLSQALTLPSQRDMFEWKAMSYCILHNIPMIGVCRGAQMMCVKAGGTLIQHVQGHNNGDHMVLTSDGVEHRTTSCHHQMMNPYKTEHELLAWASPRKSHIYEGEDDKEVAEMRLEREPEVVYFPRIRGLAIQGHPEWMRPHDSFCRYVNELIVDRLLQNHSEVV